MQDPGFWDMAMGMVRKKVLRAQRTRGPKMAKIQNSKNPIRSAQNVGRVLISMGAQALIQKGPIWAKNCEGHIFGEFWGPGPAGI